MDKHVSNSLAGVRDSSSKLNSLFDNLNRFVSRIESHLDECRVGIPVKISVEVGPEIIDPTIIRYCRVGQKFRIAVESGDLPLTPWSDCPRETKLSTVVAVPELLTVLDEAIQAKTKEVAETLRELAGAYPELVKEVAKNGSPWDKCDALLAAVPSEEINTNPDNAAPTSKGLIASHMAGSDKTETRVTVKQKGLLNVVDNNAAPTSKGLIASHTAGSDKTETRVSVKRKGLFNLDENKEDK